VAVTPNGRIEGCGLYRVRDGLMTYYKDYMNAPASDGDAA
jgi:limonene-1,2-epoxide hydrolase